MTDDITPMLGADFDDVVIPSFLRLPPSDDTLEGAKYWLAAIDRRIAWLAERGLRPHPNVLAVRAERAALVARFEEEEKQKPQ